MIRIWLIVTFLLLNLSCIPSSDVSLSAIKKSCWFYKKLNLDELLILSTAYFFNLSIHFCWGGYYDISNSTIVITPSLPWSCIHNHLLLTLNPRAKMFIRIWRHASSLIHIKFTWNSCRVNFMYKFPMQISRKITSRKNSCKR